jgi:hypothetical protein
MSDVNDLPDYDYDEDHKEPGQDADGKKYVLIPFPAYISASSLRADDQMLNRPLII